MDTTLVVIIALFAVIVVGAFLVFRQRANVEIKSPAGTGWRIDASNAPAPSTPGVKAEEIKSSGGGLVVSDESGRGTDVKPVEVKDDVLISSTPLQPDPKA